jgi:hypothetical protein
MSTLSSDFKHPVFEKASTFQEVAEFLGTDDRFVEREALAGRLHVRRFNARVIRIMPWDLVEWLSTTPVAEKEEVPA